MGKKDKVDSSTVNRSQSRARVQRGLDYKVSLEPRHSPIVKPILYRQETKIQPKQKYEPNKRFPIIFEKMPKQTFVRMQAPTMFGRNVSQYNIAQSLSTGMNSGINYCKEIPFFQDKEPSSFYEKWTTLINQG